MYAKMISKRSSRTSSFGYCWYKTWTAGGGDLSPAFYMHSTSLTQSLHFRYMYFVLYFLERSISRPMCRAALCADATLPSFFIIISRPPCMPFSPRSSATGRLGKLQLQLCPLHAVSSYQMSSFAFTGPSQCSARHCSLRFTTPCRLDLSCPLLS